MESWNRSGFAPARSIHFVVHRAGECNACRQCIVSTHPLLACNWTGDQSEGPRLKSGVFDKTLVNYHSTSCIA